MWLRIGVIGTSKEHKVDGYVWVSDKKGLQTSWFCQDHESGVAAYRVAVGTSPGMIISYTYSIFINLHLKTYL